MINEVKFIVSAETRQAAAALTSFLGGLQSGLARVAGPLAALVSVGGLTALAKQSLNAAEAMGKAAQLAGVATKEFAGMAYAADRDEVDLGNLRVALKELSNELSKTGNGSKNLKTALLEQADIFARLPDGIEKNNLAVKTFGRSGLQLIPFLNQGSASMQEMFERGERLTGINEDLAKSADEFNDALKDLHVATVGLAGSLVSSFIPALTRTLNTITEGVVKFREWAKESAVFEIAVKSLAVALAGLAVIQIGTFGLAGLTAIIGAGAIKTIADFIAALTLLPAAIAPAALALGKLTAAFAALVALMAIASALNNFGKSDLLKQETLLEQTKGNIAFTDQLNEKIKALKEEGKISEEEFKKWRLRIIEANKITDQSANRVALAEVWADLKTQVPGLTRPAPQSAEELAAERLREQEGQTERLKQLTELKNKTEQLHIARMEGIDRERAAEVERFRLETVDIEARALLVKNEDAAQLARLENQLLHRRTMAALEKKEWDERVKRELEAQQIQDDLQLAEWEHLQRVRAERQQQAVEKIQNNFLLTDAEKYDQMREAGVPKDQLGPDPRSFMENLGANITSLQNQLGMFSQAAAAMISNGIGSAIQGVSDGIMGLIDGTKTWAQTWASVLKSMAAQGIQFIVQQTAMFLLNKAKELIFHTSTEGAKTLATIAAAKLRGQAYAGEGYGAGFGAAAKAAGSVADVPYAGPYLAAAAFASTLAIVTAGFAAATAVNMASFAEGGYTGDGGKYQPVGIVHAGEWVMPASTVSAWGKDTMAAIQTGPGKAVGTSGQTDGKEKMTVFFFDSKAAMKDFVESNLGKEIIIRHVNDSRLDAGFDT